MVLRHPNIFHSPLVMGNRDLPSHHRNLAHVESQRDLLLSDSDHSLRPGQAFFTQEQHQRATSRALRARVVVALLMTAVLTGFAAAVTSLASRLDSKEIQVMDMERRVASLSNELSDYRAQAASMRANMAELRKERSHREGLERVVDAMRRQLEERGSAAHELLVANRALQTHIEEQSLRVKELEHGMGRVEADVERLTTTRSSAHHAVGF